MTSLQKPTDSALAVEPEGRAPLHRPLFAGLSEDQLDSIDKRMVSLSWAEGDQLYGAGESADHISERRRR